MSGTVRAKQVRLRGELLAYRKRGHDARYPNKLRAEATQYATQRLGQGASVPDIASELGVRESTVMVWVDGDGGVTHLVQSKPAPLSEVSLVPVTVRADPVTERVGRLEVEFVDGTRLVVSGIGQQTLTEAIAALRRSR